MRPKRPLVVDEDGVVCRPRGNTPCGGGVVGVVAVGSVAIRTPQLGRLARAGPGAPRATIAPCASKVNSPRLRGQAPKFPLRDSRRQNRRDRPRNTRNGGREDRFRKSRAQPPAAGVTSSGSSLWASSLSDA